MRVISRVVLSVSSVLYFAVKAADWLLKKWDSFIVVIMTPQEMIEFAKRKYGRWVSEYSDSAVINKGLASWEKDALAACPAGGRDLLVLAGGGGREAIAAAKMGFRVVSVDAIDEMSERGRENARAEKTEVSFKTSDILEGLTVPPGSFDCCLLSDIMYSSIPTSELRVKLLMNMHRSLRSKGMAVISFVFDSNKKNDPLLKLRRFIIRVLGGNRAYKPGDVFMPSLHFVRYFTEESEIIGEAASAGFIVEAIRDDRDESRYAILRKP